MVFLIKPQFEAGREQVKKSGVIRDAKVHLQVVESVLDFAKGFGLVVDYLCLAECQRRGFDQFDFMAGTSDYKRHLSTHEAELAWVTWRRPRLKFALLDNLRWIKRTLAGVEESLRGRASSTAAMSALDPAKDD